MSLPLLHAGRTNPGLSAALDLRFALDKSLTAYRGPTPSFSRASTGSYFDASGVLRYATVNILTYSENFSDASWLKNSTTISSDSVIAPDGKTTADTLTSTSSTAIHYLEKTGYTVSTVQYTISIFAKYGTHRYLQISANNESSGVYANFDLFSGVVGSVGASATSQITNVGGGWYRCSMTYTATSTASRPLLVMVSSSTAPRVESITLTSGDYFYIWGCQQEASSTAGTYCPTTSSANSAPRFNHTFNGTSWVSRGLLVEEQRTNALQYSESFNTSPYWAAAGGATITANQAVAPDGNTTADNVAGVNGFYQNSAGMGSSTATNTASIFAKANGSSSITLRINEWGSGINYVEGTFNLSNGTATATNAGSGSGATASMIDCGNGWYRCIITGKPSTTVGTCGYYPYGMTTSVYCWGAQFEVGASFATSYIPSLSNSSTTRSADVCQITGTDFSGFWNGTEGTVACEFDSFATIGTATYGALYFSDGGLSNYYRLMISGASVYSTYRTGGVSDATLIIGNATNSNMKAAYCFKLNDVAGSLNGAAVVTDTSVAAPVATQLEFSRTDVSGEKLNGHIARLRYYRKRLPNATLQLLSDPDPTLNLQFALNKSLTPVAGPAPSFSRASTGTYFNASGVLTSASINTPRFDHVYSGGQWVSRGLLVEEQRTNYHKYSENASLAFASTTGGVSIVSDSSVAPDGNSTADKIQEDSALTQHFVYLNASGIFSASQNAVYSIFVKSAGRKRFTLFASGYGDSTFDLISKSVVANNGVTGSIQDCGNSWLRLSISFTISATSFSIYSGLMPDNATSWNDRIYQGDGSSGVFIWGMQLEQGAFLTSYTPNLSTGSTVRSADVCQITGTSFNWMWNQGEGSVIAEYDRLANLTTSFSSGYPYISEFSDGTGSNYLVLNGFVDNPSENFTVANSGVVQAAISAGSSPSGNVPVKLATAYKLNDFAATLNGAAVVTDLSGTIPTVNQARIGARASTGGQIINGHIAKIIYYPARLTNTKLQQLST